MGREVVHGLTGIDKVGEWFDRAHHTGSRRAEPAVATHRTPAYSILAALLMATGEPEKWPKVEEKRRPHLSLGVGGAEKEPANRGGDRLP